MIVRETEEKNMLRWKNCVTLFLEKRIKNKNKKIPANYSVNDC